MANRSQILFQGWTNQEICVGFEGGTTGTQLCGLLMAHKPSILILGSRSWEQFNATKSALHHACNFAACTSKSCPFWFHRKLSLSSLQSAYFQKQMIESVAVCTLCVAWLSVCVDTHQPIHCKHLYLAPSYEYKGYLTKIFQQWWLVQYNYVFLP